MITEEEKVQSLMNEIKQVLKEVFAEEEAYKRFHPLRTYTVPVPPVKDYTAIEED